MADVRIDASSLTIRGNEPSNKSYYWGKNLLFLIAHVGLCTVWVGSYMYGANAREGSSGIFKPMANVNKTSLPYTTFNPPAYGTCATFAPEWTRAIDRYLDRWRRSGVKVTPHIWEGIAASRITIIPLALVNGTLYYHGNASWSNRVKSLTDMISQLKTSVLENGIGLPALTRRNMAFLFSAEDLPFAPVKDYPRVIPVLSSTTNVESWDIPVPHANFARQDALHQQFHPQAHTSHSSGVNITAWADRLPKAYFRGSPTCYIVRRMHPELCPRVVGLRESQRWPGDVDVAMTDVSGPIGRYLTDNNITARVPRATSYDVARHKYAISFDGNSYARRLAELLPLGSVVLKQDSHFGYEEFFHPALRAWEHFVPFTCMRDVCPIAEVVRFLRRSDEAALQIAQRGVSFSHTYLTSTARSCYFRMLLNAMAELYTDNFEIDLRGWHVLK